MGEAILLTLKFYDVNQMDVPRLICQKEITINSSNLEGGSDSSSLRVDRPGGNGAQGYGGTSAALSSNDRHLRNDVI